MNNSDSSNPTHPCVYKYILETPGARSAPSESEIVATRVPPNPHLRVSEMQVSDLPMCLYVSMNFTQQPCLHIQLILQTVYIFLYLHSKLIIRTFLFIKSLRKRSYCLCSHLNPQVVPQVACKLPTNQPTNHPLHYSGTSTSHVA